jgi:hypothetical protein
MGLAYNFNGYFVDIRIKRVARVKNVQAWEY